VVVGAQDDDTEVRSLLETHCVYLQTCVCFVLWLNADLAGFPHRRRGKDELQKDSFSPYFEEIAPICCIMPNASFSPHTSLILPSER